MSRPYVVTYWAPAGTMRVHGLQSLVYLASPLLDTICAYFCSIFLPLHTFPDADSFALALPPLFHASFRSHSIPTHTSRPIPDRICFPATSPRLTHGLYHTKSLT